MCNGGKYKPFISLNVVEYLQTYMYLFQYTYIPRESEKMAKVDVVWNNNFYIDDENDVQGKL